MSRYRLRGPFSFVLVAILALGLAAPAFAAGRPRFAATPTGLGVQLWIWLLGAWGKEGATMDPSGWPKSGATIDPSGQPHNSVAAGCPAQSEIGATLDPNGNCGTR